jgi:hypothetical protein
MPGQHTALGIFYVIMPLDLEAYNTEIKSWLDNATTRMKSAGSSQGVQHRKGSPSSSPSLNKVSNRVKLNDGAISVLSIRFPRQLIWTMKGAGKGRAGSKGSSWLDKYGTTKKTNPESFGKMATGGRREKQFINQELDGPEGIELLATIAAEKMGAAITSNLFVK